MRFGIAPPYDTGVVTDPDWMAAFARHADDVGFESIYLAEHLAVVGGRRGGPEGRPELPGDTAFPDVLETLAFLAGRTSELRLHTSVLVLPLHHPVHLAKRVATLDRLSGGRVTVGVGVGGMRDEITALGVDPSTRGRRADESIAALRVLWRDDPASFEGEFYRFSGVRSHPRPVREGGPPIHVGGHSAAAARRAGRLGDGFHPLGVPLDGLDANGGLLAVMREAARAAGRDPDAIEVTVTLPMGEVDRETIELAVREGVTRVVLANRSAGLDQLRRAMDDFAASHPMP
jgi:probable F420-dependent oxidoreductase